MHNFISYSFRNVLIFFFQNVSESFWFLFTEFKNVLPGPAVTDVPTVSRGSYENGTRSSDDSTMAVIRSPGIVVTYTHTIASNRGFSDTW